MFDSFSMWLTGSMIGPSIMPPIANWAKRLVTDKTPTNQTLIDNLHPITAVKDGQLCWVSAALSVTGIFEIIVSSDKGVATAVYILAICCSLFGNGIVFAEGAGNPTPWPGTPILQMRKLWASFILLIATTVCCFCIHYDRDVQAVLRAAWSGIFQ